MREELPCKNKTRTAFSISYGYLLSNSIEERFMPVCILLLGKVSRILSGT